MNSLGMISFLRGGFRRRIRDKPVRKPPDLNDASLKKTQKGGPAVQRSPDFVSERLLRG